MPIRLENLGQTCFLNALVQCLAGSPGLQAKHLRSSREHLDQLILQVLDEDHRQTNTRHFGNLALSTPLMKQIFDREIGQQGQQDPSEFFTKACTRDGYLAKQFKFAVAQILKCSDCARIVGEQQRVSENYINELSYENYGSEVPTISDLYLRNITSSIAGYLPPPHNRNLTHVSCSNNAGAFSVRYCIGRLPQYICLSVPSFRPQQRRRFKLEHDINLPEIGNTITTGKSSSVTHIKYSLFATVVHHGITQHGGHYTAYVQEDNKWFHLVRHPQHAHSSKAKGRFYRGLVLFCLFENLFNPSQFAAVQLKKCQFIGALANKRIGCLTLCIFKNCSSI